MLICTTLDPTSRRPYTLHDLHFFIPYFKDRGIRDVYEITKIRTIKGSEAKQLSGGEEELDDIRLAFHLRFHHRLSDEIQRIDTSKMINYTFIDSNFEELETLIKDGGKSFFFLFDLPTH